MADAPPELPGVESRRPRKPREGGDGGSAAGEEAGVKRSRPVDETSQADEHAIKKAKADKAARRAARAAEAAADALATVATSAGTLPANILSEPHLQSPFAAAPPSSLPSQAAHQPSPPVAASSAPKPPRKQLPLTQEKLSAKWHNASEIQQLQQNEGVQLRTGKFTKREDEILESAVQTFLDMNSLVEDDLRSFLFRDRSVADKDVRFKGFWNHVADQLKERSLHSLYSHLKRLHHPGNHLGPFSPAEDDVLRRLVVQHGNAWSKIGAAMGRMPASCRDRYREITSEKRASGQWLRHENDALRDAIAAFAGDKGALPESDIPWEKVASMVKTRTPHQCRTHWYNYLSIREHRKDANPVWELEDDVKLLDRLAELGYEDERDIQWPVVAKGLSAWGTDRCRERWGIIKKTLDESLRSRSLDDVLQVLRNDWPERRKAIRRPPQRRHGGVDMGSGVMADSIDES